MEQKRKTVITFGILVVLIITLFVFSSWFSKTTGYFLGEDEKERFAICLSEKNATFYSTVDCLECQTQLEIFGKSENYIRKVECGKSLCSGLREVPAWEIDGEFYYGRMDFKELSKISGCEIN